MQFDILKESELQEAIEIGVAAFDEEDRPSAIREFGCMFSQDSFRPIVLTAKKDGKLVAVLMFIEDYITYNVYSISWVCVHPDYQGQGVGTALLDFSIKYINTHKDKNEPAAILLHTSTAQRLYTNYGFTTLGPSHKEDGVFMMYKLQA